MQHYNDIYNFYKITCNGDCTNCMANSILYNQLLDYYGFKQNKCNTKKSKTKENVKINSDKKNENINIVPENKSYIENNLTELKSENEKIETQDQKIGFLSTVKSTFNKISGNDNNNIIRSGYDE